MKPLLPATALSLALALHAPGVWASAHWTAKLPSSGSPHSFPVDSSLGIAIIDSGVTDHADLNVANRIDFTGSTAGLTLRDEFNTSSWSNSDGSADWSSSPWIESGDNGDPWSGSITVETDYCPDTSSRCIEFDARGGVNDAITRAANLAGAESATLTFDYRVHTIGESAEFVLEASTDGGSSWSSPLATFNAVTVEYGKTVDLTPFASAHTQFRFRVTDYDPEAHFYLDNVEISTNAASSPAAFSSTLRDEFNVSNWSNSDGSDDWSSSPWDR